MTTDRWGDILTRISANYPENLDDLLAPLDPRTAKPGDEIFPDNVGLLPFASEFKADDTVVIGVRICEPPANPAELAAQFASFALERDVEMVVLSYPDYSSLEQFGFRTERICGKSEAARRLCESQLASFWNMEVII
ncbi:hypothetical protein [Pelagibacterium sp. H642]|uniref:hypothetical protein n=1 Tax=Pelagibacterium sp. H642 TaxID=1881069 RepID=UPI0028157E0B|nr:hypothetical protein [Pelagibacterium sp. H642]WMT92614.1 hypothetical protein NO934_19910 [Pelagibacterium sp. H642]